MEKRELTKYEHQVIAAALNAYASDLVVSHGRLFPNTPLPDDLQKRYRTIRDLMSVFADESLCAVFVEEERE